jgi:hypothetical protein
MTNPWKVATIGLAVAGVTALGSGLTTAWMLRPAAPAQEQVAAVATAPAPVVRYASPAPAPTRATPTVRPATLPTAPTRVTTVSTSAPAATPVDCSTGGDRALRIAKPAALGALLGAGLGAAGGAIADGGKAAGKGALIGGIAGAALGTGYGAYKTKNECGTILGNDAAPAGTAAAIPASGEGLTVYSAR